MSGGSRPRNQDATMEKAIDFLRASALVTEISGVPVLTSKGELFLGEFEEFTRGRPSGSSGQRASLGASNRSEGTSQR